MAGGAADATAAAAAAGAVDATAVDATAVDAGAVAAMAVAAGAKLRPICEYIFSGILRESISPTKEEKIAHVSLPI